MKVLVLGARGMLGSDVMTAGESVGHEISGYDRVELDVTDPDLLRRRFDREAPDAVINCAAWTDVELAEQEPEAAMAVNGTGAANVAAAAAEVQATVLYVSTGYVFDGEKRAAYVESDRIGPLNRYGLSKAAGEQATVAANRRSWVVRSSWLFGSAAPNFADLMLRLGERHGPVLASRELVGSPTWTWHLANGLIRLLDSNAYGLHHMAAAGHCSRYDFARETFRQAGLDVATMSTTAEMDSGPTPRPAWSALSSENRDRIELPPWQEGLAGYLAQRRSGT